MKSKLTKNLCKQSQENKKGKTYMITNKLNFTFMKYLSFILFFLFLQHSFSQNNAIENQASVSTMKNGLNFVGTWAPTKVVDNSISGSTYLFNSWIGNYVVIDSKGVSTKLFNLNYNIKTSMLEAAISKDSVFQYDIDNIDYVFTANKKYKIINPENKKILSEEIYKNEKFQLYKIFNIEVLFGTFNPLTQEKIQSDSYLQKKEYFLFKDGKFTKTKLSKKNILEIVKDKTDLIKTQVNKLNYSYTEESDVKAILDYYDTL